MKNAVASTMVWCLCLAAVTPALATPPPEPVDWAAQLPAGRWIIGAVPWEDHSACNLVCNAALNASPYLVNVRLSYHAGPQISLHGSVTGCTTTFQRSETNVDLNLAETRTWLAHEITDLVGSMKSECHLSEDARIPPLTIEMFQAVGGPDSAQEAHR